MEAQRNGLLHLRSKTVPDISGIRNLDKAMRSLEETWEALEISRSGKAASPLGVFAAECLASLAGRDAGKAGRNYERRAYQWESGSAAVSAFGLGGAIFWAGAPATFLISPLAGAAFSLLFAFSHAWPQRRAQTRVRIDGRRVVWMSFLFTLGFSATGTLASSLSTDTSPQAFLLILGSCTVLWALIAALHANLDSEQTDGAPFHYCPISGVAFRWAGVFIGAFRRMGVPVKFGVRLYKWLGAAFFQETLSRQGAGFTLPPLLAIGFMRGALAEMIPWLPAVAFTLLAAARILFIRAHTPGQRIPPALVGAAVLLVQSALLLTGTFSWDRLAGAYAASVLTASAVALLLDLGRSNHQRHVELSQFATILRSRGYLPLANEITPAYRDRTRAGVPGLDRERIFSSPQEIVTALKSAWERNVEASRPFWKSDPRYRFRYGADAPSIAYDPRLIHERPLGPFVQALYEPPAESNAKVQTRRQIREEETRTPKNSLVNELTNEMMADPGRYEELAVVPNRWPRRPYHSLVVSRAEDLPQRLTPAFIWSELEWASRGVVVEFHRRGLLLNHFHFHLIPAEYAPVARHAASFESIAAHAHLEIGVLRDYPVPHLAVSASRMGVLNRAVQLLCAQLESEGRWYNQVVTRNPNDSRLISLFFLWPDRWIDGFSFNEFGLIRSENTALTEESAVKAIRAAHTAGHELEDFRLRFWSHWKEHAVLDSTLVVSSALSALRKASHGWSHVRPRDLGQKDLRRVYDLYQRSYTSPSLWRKFTPFTEGTDRRSHLEEFRSHYDHVFFHRDRRGEINAFLMGVDSAFGIRCNLLGREETAKPLLMRSFLTLNDVEGLYSFVSGPVMELFLSQSLRARRFSPPVPVIDPEAAATHFGMDDARPDMDGVRYYRWRVDDGRRVRKHGIIIGRPSLPGSSAERRLARPGRSFAFHRELESAERDGGASTTKKLRSLLKALEEAGTLAEEDDDARLEAWRLQLLRLKALLSLKQREGGYDGLWDAYVGLDRLETRLPAPLTETPPGIELLRVSKEWKPELVKYGRRLLTNEFTETQPVLARGRHNVLSLLAGQADGGFRVMALAGAPAVGKTTLAVALKESLQQRGRHVIIVPTDAFLRPRVSREVLLSSLWESRAEETLWDLEGYKSFLKAVDTFKRSGRHQATVAIQRYYDTEIKARRDRNLLLREDTLLIVEGWGAVDEATRDAFDISIWLDVKDDESLKRVLLERRKEKLGGGTSREDTAYLTKRFDVFDRPLAASFRMAGRTAFFDLILDNSDPRNPVMYRGMKQPPAPPETSMGWHSS